MSEKTFPIPLATPPWPGLGRRLETLCRKALHTFDLLEEAATVAVALSGGKDSLTLLFLLHAILGRGFPKLDLAAIHIDGAYSCGAEVSTKYLGAICENLGVPLLIRQSNQSPGSLECYSCSRERRKLLFNAAKDVGAHTIAFGHHRDDVVQTLLMNLLHKAEFASLLPKVPMVRYDVTLIRPLFFIPEALIKEFAKQNDFARVVCQCPKGGLSLRKKTDTLLNVMEEIFPHARENLASAGLMYGSDKALKP